MFGKTKRNIEALNGNVRHLIHIVQNSCEHDYKFYEQFSPHCSDFVCKKCYLTKRVCIDDLTPKQRSALEALGVIEKEK